MWKEYSFLPNQEKLGLEKGKPWESVNPHTQTSYLVTLNLFTIDKCSNEACFVRSVCQDDIWQIIFEKENKQILSAPFKVKVIIES